MPSLTPKKGKDLNFANAPVNDLILFSVYSVLLSNETCSFDRLIKECFTLFPRIFGFERYPLWPDARRLDRPLRALRKQKFITGDPKNEFFITEEGKVKAAQIQKSLRQGKLL